MNGTAAMQGATPGLLSAGRAQSEGLVVLHGLSKIYGQGMAAVHALREVSLTIAVGEFVAIMGPSGSGKSTCMNIIGCLDTPTSGSYRFGGIDVGALTRNQRALLRRHYLGFVFQGYNLLDRTSAMENVELPLLYRGIARDERRARAAAALAVVGLSGREQHTPSELSGGQQQRVAIARALVTEPMLLLADEPTGNVDTRTSEEIMNLLSSLNAERNITIAMVTHEEPMAAYAHRLISFVDGEVVDDQRQERTARGTREGTAEVTSEVTRVVSQ